MLSKRRNHLTNSIEQMSSSDVERLQTLTRSLLDSATLASSMRPEVIELSELIGARQGEGEDRDHNISLGETLTANGLALSPRMASMCLDDVARTVIFMRGVYSAINDLRGEIDGRPVRVLYAGCGPFAPLCLPLMSVLPAGMAEFTLLDIHAESISSARALVKRLGLDNSIASYVTEDACDYRIDSAHPPDLIVIEVLQACLQAEPQVAVARHLLAQAPAALLVPERISIRLDLVDVGKEFSVSGSANERSSQQRGRLASGELFCLDRQSIVAWGECRDDVLPAASVQLPESWDRRYQPMAFTEITSYRAHRLGDYDSGLTCPRSPTIDGALEPGVLIDFSYELGHNPGLIGRCRDTARRP